MAREIPESLDVSCRATAHVIYWFLVNNKPTSCLIEGLPYSLVHLQNASASISWTHYLRFITNCHSLLNENEWREHSQNYGESPYLTSMLTIAGLWLFPARCFAWGLGSRGNMVGAIFRCVRTNSLVVTRRECQVEFQLPEPHALPPDFFWQAMAYGFKGSAFHLGIGPIGDVRWEPVDRGVRFTIPFPRPSLSRFVRRLIGSFVRRDLARNTRLREKYLMDREQWLQEEVSKRIASEQALRESEAQLRVLMEVAPEAIVVFDLDQDRIVTVNRNAEDLFCENESSLVKVSLFDLISLAPAGDKIALQKLVDRALSGKTEVFEFNYTTPDNVQIPCEARLVRLPSNRRLLVRASITDISARKQNEFDLLRARDQALEVAAKLQQREQELTVYSDRLKEVIRITRTGIFEHDHISSTLYRSPEILEIYGRNSELSNFAYDFINWVVSEDRVELIEKIHRSHSPDSNGQFQAIYRVARPSGEVVWCEARATTSFQGDGKDRKPVRTVGAVVDVTERIMQEKLLRNSRGYLQAILESTSDLVFSLDRQLRYLAFNRHHFEIMKRVYGVEINLGDCILDCATVEMDKEIFEACCHRALAGERFSAVQPYGDSAFSRASFEITFNPIRTDAGEVTGVAVFARDTSEQIRARNALQESEELQRLAIEISELGLWRFNTRTQLFTLDNRTQRLLGFENQVVSREDFESRIHPDDLPDVTEEVDRLYASDSQGIFKTEHRVLLPDDTCRWVVACRARLLKLSSEGASGELEFIGTIMDVSERVQTSNLLTASLNEKNAMLKEIHHRVKNNLQVICSLLSLQASHVQSKEVMEYSLESQRRVRAMALVHETLYQTETLAKIDMTQYVSQLCHSLIQSYGAEQATVEKEIDDLYLEIEQALPIGLILSELITNSLKHGFPGGSDHGIIHVGLRVATDASALLLRVADNGIGLPAQWNLEETNSLGLKLVQLLTQQLQATLKATSSPGANFEIEIPYVRAT